MNANLKIFPNAIIFPIQNNCFEYIKRILNSKEEEDFLLQNNY